MLKSYLVLEKCDQQNPAPPSLSNIPEASLTGDDVLNVASVAQTCGLRAGTNEANVGEIRRFLTDGCQTFSRLVPFFVDDIWCEKANLAKKWRILKNSGKLSFLSVTLSNRDVFSTHPLAKMFTLNRASHPYQGDAVTALWSQLWAFLGWYNAVQLVPRYETKEPETAREGQVHGGLPGCLKICVFFSWFVVARLFRMVITWWSLRCCFDLFFLLNFRCLHLFQDNVAVTVFGRCSRSLEKNNSLFTKHWLLGFQSYCKQVFNAIHLGSWMLIVPRIRHGIGNYSRRLGSLPPLERPLTHLKSTAERSTWSLLGLTLHSWKGKTKQIWRPRFGLVWYIRYLNLFLWLLPFLSSHVLCSTHMCFLQLYLGNISRHSASYLCFVFAQQIQHKKLL